MKYEEMTKEQCDELDAKFFKLSDEYMERVERAREKMEKLQKMDDLMEYYINHVRPFVQRSEIICAKWVSEFEVYVQFTDMEKFLIDTNSDSYVRLPYTKYNVPDDFAGR